MATTVAVMRVWLSERSGQPDDPLFATTTGRPLSRDAVERRVRLATTRARADCPSLAAKQVTAHTLRHTAAMRLLHAGVDVTVIALCLGHKQIATTNIYLHADMTIKENAIAEITPQDATTGRYQPSDTILAFLNSLRLCRPPDQTHRPGTGSGRHNHSGGTTPPEALGKVGREGQAGRPGR